VTNAFSGQRRYLALRLPFLPTDRLRRIMAATGGQPDRDALPHIVFANDRGALRLTAVNPAALAAGLHAGMTLADARGRTPELMASEANPAADATLLERIALWSMRWTPLAALSPPDAVILDVTGSSHLFGGEAALLGAAESALRRQGLHVVAALARTPSMARALALGGVAGVLAAEPPDPHPEPVEGSRTSANAVRSTSTLRQAQDEVGWRGRSHTTASGEAILHSLPLAALELPEDAARLMQRLGLKTIGALDVQPRAPLAARSGRALLDRLDAVMGRVEEPFHSLVPLPECLAERAFAHPVTEESALLRTISRLAGDLAELLANRGEGARRYEAQFFRADGVTCRLAVETGRPTRDPAVVERLFRERLASLADPLDPGFGFDLVRLAVTRAERFDDAPRDFDASEAAAQAEALLIDQLSVKLGAACVTRPLPVDTHWPERAVEHLPAQQIAAPVEPWPVLRGPGEPPARPIRLFEPPEPVEAMAEVPDGPPARFRWRRVLHDVARAEGPERIAPEWWRGGPRPPLTRDYFRIEDAQGRRFWLFREGLYGLERDEPRWFLHGVFA
jgi:protein ImuB